MDVVEGDAVFVVEGVAVTVPLTARVVAGRLVVAGAAVTIPVEIVSNEEKDHVFVAPSGSNDRQNRRTRSVLQVARRPW